MKKILILLLSWLAPGASLSAEPTLETSARPAFTEQYVMLYYTELEPAAQFYEQTLGLTATMKDEWVELYEVVPGSLIGLVRAGGTAYHRVQDTNAVMVSIVTEDVDAWYGIVADNPNINILKPIYNHATVPIRAFLLADPGGYTVEIFQWLK